MNKTRRKVTLALVSILVGGALTACGGGGSSEGNGSSGESQFILQIGCVTGGGSERWFRVEIDAETLEITVTSVATDPGNGNFGVISTSQSADRISVTVRGVPPSSSGVSQTCAIPVTSSGGGLVNILDTSGASRGFRFDFTVGGDPLSITIDNFRIDTDVQFI